MIPTVTVETDIVLLGGGHAHVAVLKRFGMRPQPGVRLTLVTPGMAAPYSGMLPGLLAGHYTHEQAHVDLEPLARFAGARLYRAAATGIDLDARQVICPGRPPVPFDLVSLDIGSTPIVDGIAGAREHALAVKPVEGFLEQLARVERRLLQGDGWLRVVVVGAGAGGVELALSVRHRLAQHLDQAGLATDGLRVSVLTAEERTLPGHSPGVRRRLHEAMREHGVELHTNTRVSAITETQVICEARPPIGCDAAILVTGAAPARWLTDIGLALDARGFVRVDEQLRSVSHPNVFAAGDVASIDGYRLAKSGVFAVRQGPILADNLRRSVDGRALRRYRPQRRTLSLISTGDQHAVASWGNWSAQGAWAWRLKDWIDRRWMRSYQELPHMAATEGADGAQAMPCAGCGSKVPASLLARVLARLEPGRSPDVLVGLGDDAAVIRPPPGQVLVQSVDHFRAFIDDPWTLGRITAVHCLSDLHAMGATPHSAQAMVTLAWTSETKLEYELHALLAGALSVLRAEGAVLVGGHTAQGAETSFGLAVNGFADANALLRKNALRADDVLILTKPLGSGVILAADMRGQSSGVSMGAALDGMLVSNAAAARCLREHGARACTDITGFGLLGHLVEMLSASGMDAHLDLACVPALPGALALLGKGIESTLAPSNGSFLTHVSGEAPTPSHLALLTDPQTAGGLLAGVPAARAAQAVAALVALGYRQACIIGAVTAPASPGAPRVTLGVNSRGQIP